MFKEKLLIKRAKLGCKESMAEMYMQYKDDLLSLATALLHDRSAAEDVLHDVFVSFTRVIGDLQLRGSLKAYLMTSVANRARDTFRRRKTQVEKLQKLEVAEIDTQTPAKCAVLEDDIKQLKSALEQLPYDQKEVVLLRVRGGLSFKEIGAQQNINPNTARGRYRYGLKKLRSILNCEVQK